MIVLSDSQQTHQNIHLLQIQDEDTCCILAKTEFEYCSEIFLQQLLKLTLRNFV